MTSWPWLKKEPTLDHPFVMTCCSMALSFFNLCMSSPSAVWTLLGLRPDLLEPRWVFNSCRSAFIVAYCVVLVLKRCSRTSLLLVAADAMLSMSLIKESTKLSAGIAPGGGTWVQLLDVSGRTLSPLCDIPWIYTAALTSQKNLRRGWGVEWRSWAPPACLGSGTSTFPKW